MTTLHYKFWGYTWIYTKNRWLFNQASKRGVHYNLQDLTDHNRYTHVTWY